MRRKARRVVVAGSSSFPLTPEVGGEVVEILRGYPEETVFLTRGSPGFDTFIVRATAIIQRPCVRYPSLGGSKNWDRDVQIVRDADEVLIFFDPDSLHDLNTGTAHIAEKALDQKRKTTAYTIAANHLVYAGSTE